MLWIGPNARTYVIVLSNRTYPDGARDAGPLRKKVLALVSDRLGPLTEAQVLADEPELSSFSRNGKGERDRDAGRGGDRPRFWPPTATGSSRALPTAQHHSLVAGTTFAQVPWQSSSLRLSERVFQQQVSSFLMPLL